MPPANRSLTKGSSRGHASPSNDDHFPDTETQCRRSFEIFPTTMSSRDTHSPTLNDINIIGRGGLEEPLEELAG
jgi:hypothetical protein